LLVKFNELHTIRKTMLTQVTIDKYECKNIKKLKLKNDSTINGKF